MGNGSSIIGRGGGVTSTRDKEALVEELLQVYSQNPSMWDGVIEDCKQRYRSRSFGEKNNQKAVSYGTCVSLSQEIANEINLVRSNPRSYCQFLREKLNTFIDDFVYRNQDGNLVKSREGKKVVEETIAYLNGHETCPKVEADMFLELSSLDHCQDLVQSNLANHEGSRGHSLRDRVEIHAGWSGLLGENLAFLNENYENFFHQSFHDSESKSEEYYLARNRLARHMIIELLIDDGVPSRGHRLNIMKKEFHRVGGVVAPHPSFTCCGVMNFAGSTVDKSLILHEDAMYSFKSASDLSSDGARRLFLTIPDSTSIRENILNEVNHGTQVVAEYFHSKKEAKISFLQENMTKIQTVSWGK